MPEDKMEFEICSDMETVLGEGPVWDDARQLLWLVDIVAPAVLSFDPLTRAVMRFPTPDLVTSIGLTQDERLILSLRKAVYFFTPSTGSFDHFVTLESDDSPNRLNDGKIGPDGAFWVGSMHEVRPAQPTAALYRVAVDGTVRTVLRDLRVSNGLAWSPDHRVMYHADSREPSIKAWDFNVVDGTLGSGRLLAAPSMEEGLPDGAAVDTGGNYWSAGVTGGCIHVFTPGGALLRRIPVPMRAPTMPCFGGRDGSTLFLTGLTREENGVVSKGRLMACQTTARGVPIARFGQVLSSRQTEDRAV